MDTKLPQFVTGKTCWRISKVPDFPTFLRNLPSLVPSGSVLCLEGTGAEDIEGYLSQRPAIYPNEVTQGFLSMRAKTYFMPVTLENLHGLAELAEHHAEPEICDHLRVYFNDKAVLAWHDISDDPLDIGDQIDESRIRAFTDELDTTYEGGVEPI